MNNRYQIDPTRLRGQPDIIEYIKDINERVKSGETGLRIGHTSIEDGDLVVLNGDIRVKETDGTTVLQILHGSVPEIRMFPLGDTDTHQISWFGFDFGTPPDTDQGSQMQVERVADLFQDGGKLFLGRSYALLSHWEFGEQETYIWLNFDPSIPELIQFNGKLRDSFQYDTGQLFYAGAMSVTGGFATWTHTYFSTWDDTMLPIITTNLNGSTTQWVLDSFDLTQFTVRFNPTAGAKTVTFLVMRCGS